MKVSGATLPSKRSPNYGPFFTSRERYRRHFIPDIGWSWGSAGHVSRSRRSTGLKPMARFVAYATAGVAPEEMGIGPAFAIPKALKLAGLRLDEIDVIELNEAFAAQALAVMKELNLDLERTKSTAARSLSGIRWAARSRN
jgi:acetyl-CoA acetyltransferase